MFVGRSRFRLFSALLVALANRFITDKVNFDLSPVEI